MNKSTPKRRTISNRLREVLADFADNFDNLCWLFGDDTLGEDEQQELDTMKEQMKELKSLAGLDPA